MATSPPHGHREDVDSDSFPAPCPVYEYPSSSLANTHMIPLRINSIRSSYYIQDKPSTPSVLQGWNLKRWRSDRDLSVAAKLLELMATDVNSRPDRSVTRHSKSMTLDFNQRILWVSPRTFFCYHCACKWNSMPNSNGQIFSNSHWTYTLGSNKSKG